MRLLVWLGGGLFVSALGLTAWTYAVVFGRDLPAEPWPAAAVTMLIDLVLFSGFALHHSLFARDRVKALISRVVPAPLLRSTYVWVASVLLIIVDLGWQPIGGSWYRLAPPAAWLCLAVQAVGVWFTVRGAAAIDPFELAGIRDSIKPVALQVGGPYRLVRHPLYFGWMLIVFATSHMTGDRLVFAVVSTAYLAIAIPFEEQSLLRLFGADYEHYRHRVRWRMIPYLY
jgi:protein-S-isoprenylcysteine O-methyltransferase Ste14